MNGFGGETADYCDKRVKMGHELHLIFAFLSPEVRADASLA
jgi:hypothetical protein